PVDEALAQEPGDPEAMAALMRGMKAAALRVIEAHTAPRRSDIQAGTSRTQARAQAGTQAAQAETLCRHGARAIAQVMVPVFGPANAWLFNERSAAITHLCDELEVGARTCDQIKAEATAAVPELTHSEDVA